MIMTNHTYDVIGSMFPQKEMGGGSGLKYAASSIVYLGKRKEKDGTEVVGNIIHCKNYKSRLTKENAQIDVKLTYKKGLDKYYGLIGLAEEAGIFKKVSTRYEMPDRSKVFGKNVNDDPEKYELFPLFQAMAERGLKVWFYAEPAQVEMFDRVLERLPNLVAVFNHCGFMVSLDNLSIDQHARPHFDVPIPPPTLDLLERVGEKLNTYVHFSGQYAFSHEPYPHQDMAPVAQRLYKIFGPERMLWASDFPWILEVPGYEEQLNLVDIMLPDLSKKELNLIKGGNAELLFNF